MDVQIEKIGPVKTKITLTIDAEAVAKEMERVYKKIRREVIVPGFRPGKAPMSMLKRRYSEYAEQEVKSNLVGEKLAMAVEENDVKVMGTPELEKDEFNEEGSLTIVAVMETRPEVELGEYKGFEIEQEKAVVLDEAVEQRLQQKREQFATMEEIEDRDVAEKGDHVRIDFVGKKDGKEFKGGSHENYVLELGSESFIPGFEDGVIGMKKGETKDIELTFPESYGREELAGKEVVFTVTLNAILRKEVPELDDEFAKDTGEAESLDELKQKIHDEILKSEEDRTKGQARRQLLDKLIAAHDLEVPASLVEKQLDYEVRRYRMEMMMAGIPAPEGPEMDQMMRERLADEAKKQVQQAFLLDAIAETEKIEVTDEDVEAELQKIAEQQGRPVEQISAQYQKENMIDWLQEKLKEDKVVDFLFESAKVTLTDGPLAGEVEEPKEVEENDESADKEARVEETPPSDDTEKQE